MKYTGRLITVLIIFLTGAIFKINDLISLGYIPLSEWILNGIFLLPGWWCGLQYDKAKYYGKELKKKEEEVNRLLQVQLDETEQRLKSLFAYNSDPIFTFNSKGKLIAANNAAEVLLGYTFDELLELGREKVIVQEDIEKYAEYERIIRKGIPQEFSISMIRKDFIIREISIKIIPIISEKEFLGLYTIAKDITDTKLTEEMLRRSEKLTVVGQLAAGVAHEIRNPLTTLRGFVQFLISEKEKHYGEIMLAELDRINLIVSEFLILAKPQVINYQVKDLNSILIDIISLLETQANINNVQILPEFGTDIPLIKCEQNQLKQVFINLLKNAIEAMPNGGIVLVSTKRVNNCMVSINIIDHGIGIPEEQIPKLGEPFNTTKENGTGLGLMVCFKIIEDHGGKITITSQLNRGTDVEVCLPINRDLE